MTNAVKQRLSQLRALLDILDQRREKANGEHTADLQEKIYAIELAIAHYEAALKIESRIQCSRFSPSILPSAVRWQQRRANLSERPLLAAFVPIQQMAALPPLKMHGRPCKTTKCLRHISLGLNFGGVRRHFGLPLQSSNLIGDFRSVAAIRNLCCRFQRFIDGRERKATASCFKARQTILCADIFCQSHTNTYQH